MRAVMSIDRRRTWSSVALLTTAMAFGPAFAFSEGGAREDTHLRGAIEVGRWLQSLAERSASGAIPVEITEERTSGDLASGSAGHALFFAELYSATGNEAYRESAVAAGRRALAEIPDGYGLYGGRSGVAFTLAELARLEGEPELREEARDLFHDIANRGKASELDGGVPWGSVHDVLGGRAGVGLALLHGFESLGDEALLEAAIHEGTALLEVAESLPEGGVRWLRGLENPWDLPNFSHGTAGVGYFLARLARVTEEPRFETFAQGAADYLDEVADRRDGLYLVPYGVPNEGFNTAFDVGWAHGPAGTARLFYLDWRETRDEGMTARLDASARSILASGTPGPSRDPALWTATERIDQRFGGSGAARFLSDWGRVGGNEELVEAATRIVDDILARAIRSGDGMYWRLPRYGFQGGEGDAVFTGYFYGAAGLGLTLLHQHYATIGEWPRIRLPDDPFPRQEIDEFR